MSDTSGKGSPPSYPLLQPLLSRIRSHPSPQQRKENKYGEPQLPTALHELTLDPSPYHLPTLSPAQPSPCSSPSSLSSQLSNTYLSSLLRHAKHHINTHHMVSTHRLYQRAVLLHVHQHSFPQVLVDIIIEYLPSYRLAVSFGTNIDIFDMSDGQPQRSLSMEHDEYDSPILFSSPTSSPTSTLYHTFANITALHHVDRMNMEITNEHTIRAMCVLSDGSLVTTSASPMSRHEHINIWNICDKKLIKHYKKTPTAYISCSETLFFDNHDAIRPSQLQQPHRIVVGCDDSSVRIYNIDTNIFEFISPYPQRNHMSSHNVGHAQGVACIHQLCDGRIISGGFDHNIRVWELSKHHNTRAQPPLPYQCSMLLQGHTDCVSGIVELTTTSPSISSHTTSYIASISFDGTTRIWDLSSGTCIQILTEHTSSITCITMLCDGTLLTGSRDGMIHIYYPHHNHTYIHLTSMNIEHETRTYLRRIITLPTKDTFLTATSDGMVKMWNLTYTHTTTYHPLDIDEEMEHEIPSPSSHFSMSDMHMISSSPSPSASPFPSSNMITSPCISSSPRSIPTPHITCLHTLRQRSPIDSRICVMVLPPD